jgi:hypothetical protein
MKEKTAGRGQRQSGEEVDGSGRQGPTVGYAGIFSERGGVQQIQLRTEGRENGNLGAVAPSQGFRSTCK